eukprot:scaffold5329_cov112-Isochrysis_galbana.AAC.10
MPEGAVVRPGRDARVCAANNVFIPARAAECGRGAIARCNHHRGAPVVARAGGGCSGDARIDELEARGRLAGGVQLRDAHGPRTREAVGHQVPQRRRVWSLARWPARRVPAHPSREIVERHIDLVADDGQPVSVDPHRLVRGARPGVVASAVFVEDDLLHHESDPDLTLEDGVGAGDGDGRLAERGLAPAGDRHEPVIQEKAHADLVHGWLGEAVGQAGGGGAVKAVKARVDRVHGFAVGAGEREGEEAAGASGAAPRGMRVPVGFAVAAKDAPRPLHRPVGPTAAVHRNFHVGRDGPRVLQQIDRPRRSSAGDVLTAALRVELQCEAVRRPAVHVHMRGVMQIKRGQCTQLCCQQDRGHCARRSRRHPGLQAIAGKCGLIAAGNRALKERARASTCRNRRRQHAGSARAPRAELLARH